MIYPPKEGLHARSIYNMRVSRDESDEMTYAPTSAPRSDVRFAHQPLAPTDPKAPGSSLGADLPGRNHGLAALNGKRVDRVTYFMRINAAAKLQCQGVIRNTTPYPYVPPYSAVP